MPVAIIAFFFTLQSSFAGDLPRCLTGGATGEEMVRKAGISDEELLARLVLAEGVSALGKDATCAESSGAIMEAIAWGVMSRVRLAKAYRALARRYGSGISGVIFKRGQFNPAVSKHSRFAPIFLCPRDPRWGQALTAARHALGSTDSPFPKTEWERKHHLSLVTQFYYPSSVQATPAPPTWADTSAGSKTWVKDITIAGKPLPDRCIWLFRSAPPSPPPR